MSKYLLALLFVACLAALVLFVEFRSRPKVETWPAFDKGLVVYAPGRVEGTGETRELRPSLQGRLVRRFVDEDQIVSEGEILLQIEDEELTAQRDLAAAELAAAQEQLVRLKSGYRQFEKDEAKALLSAKAAELRRAELNWQRTSKLRANNVGTAQEADHHFAEVDVLTALVAAAKARSELVHAGPRDEDVRIAEVQVQAARARLALAQSRLDRTQLKAPSSGRVLKVNAEQGELLGPDSTEPAIMLCDTSRLRVRAFVEEFEALRVRLGAPVQITADGLPGRALRGNVSRLAPRMTSKQLWSDNPSERLDTKVREIWIDLEEPGDLVPGLPVEVSIDVSPTSDDSPQA